MTVVERVEQAWCPTCREWTVMPAGAACAWCETVLVERRGGWSRPDLRSSRFSPVLLAKLHDAYMRGASCRTLGAVVYQRLGYKSAASAGEAIRRGFQRAGLPVRSQSEATAQRNFKHGRRRRENTAEHGTGGYRRWLKEQRGQYQPRCAGVKQQPPRQGQRCERPAAHGSDFCHVHDPARHREVAAITASMRARRRHDPACIPWRDVHDRLRPWLAQQRHPAAALSRATGVPHGTCSRLLLGRQDKLTRSLAARLLEPTRPP